MNPSDNEDELFSIAAVERDTGVGKDTLRAWEKRYGFPQPVRDAHGERAYPRTQLDRLRLVKRLIDSGLRPGKIFAAPESALSEWLLQLAPVQPDRTHAHLSSLMESLRLQHCNELRMALQQLLLKHGLQRFVCEVIAPMNREVGEAWQRGEIDVPEEHAYTEQVQNLLRGAIHATPPSVSGPQILLTTFPEEPHSLGLLMAESMLVPEGARCLSLGTQTPIADIAAAARNGGFDIVALSFSAAYPLRGAVAGLRQLAATVPESTEIWAGGRSLTEARGMPASIRLIPSIDAVPQELERWRSARQSAANLLGH